MDKVKTIKKKIISFAKDNNINYTEVDKCFLQTDLINVSLNLEKLEDNLLTNFAKELIYEELLISESYKIERTGMKLGLHRMKKILKILSSPEKDLKVIHIAGTNGKGSVSNYLKDALKTKYKVGFYSSPGLVSFNDRIRINDEFIPYTKMYNLFNLVKETWQNSDNTDGENLSFFEILTAVALLYFKEKKTDFVIMEVGLGGRYDASNIFDEKILSIITKISLDHTAILGDTLEKIAFEKSGIIQKNDNVITYMQDTKAYNVIKNVCREKNAKLTTLDIKDIKIEKISLRENIFSYKNYSYVKIKMIGEHQIYNASLALLALSDMLDRKIIDIDNKTILESFKTSSWAGRLEWLRENILLDGAHNKDGMTSLVNYLKKAKIKNLKILIGILEDKDYKEMITLLETLCAKFYITKVPIDIKNSSIENIKQSFSKDVKTFDNYKIALTHILEELKEDDTLVISGSLYLVAEVRKFLLENKK